MRRSVIVRLEPGETQEVRRPRSTKRSSKEGLGACTLVLFKLLMFSFKAHHLLCTSLMKVGSEFTCQRLGEPVELTDFPSQDACLARGPILSQSSPEEGRWRPFACHEPVTYSVADLAGDVIGFVMGRACCATVPHRLDSTPVPGRLGAV